MSPRLLSLSLALVVGAAAAAPPLAAQEPAGPSFLFGLGGGYGTVRATSARASAPHGTARAGVRISRHLAAVLELGVFGPRNESPRVGDLVVDERGVSTVTVRRPRMLRTWTLLAGLQVGRRDGLYVRPALGLGSHSFAAYGPWPAMDSAMTGSEIGPAIALSVGYALRVGPHLSLALEGVAVGSGGEDSTAGRSIVGFQVVPVLHR